MSISNQYLYGADPKLKPRTHRLFFQSERNVLVTTFLFPFSIIASALYRTTDDSTELLQILSTVANRNRKKGGADGDQRSTKSSHDLFLF